MPRYVFPICIKSIVYWLLQVLNPSVKLAYVENQWNEKEVQKVKLRLESLVCTIELNERQSTHKLFTSLIITTDQPQLLKQAQPRPFTQEESIMDMVTHGSSEWFNNEEYKTNRVRHQGMSYMLISMIHLWAMRVSLIGGRWVYFKMSFHSKLTSKYSTGQSNPLPNDGTHRAWLSCNTGGLNFSGTCIFKRTPH